MKLRWIILAFSLLGAAPACADGFSAPITTVNGCGPGACTVQPGNFLGSFTVATLLASKPCDGSTVPYGSIAFVSDLGGGGNNVKCLNAGGVNAWTHFNYGIPGASSAASGTVTITPLLSPQIMQLTSTVAVATTLTVQLQTTNLYPGYDFYVLPPASILGTMNVTVQGVGGLSLPITTAGVPHHYSWNGTTLITLQ